MAPTPTPNSITPRTYQLQIEHRSGKISQVTVIIPPVTMTTNTIHIPWKTMKKNLTHKEKALEAMGLLGVRVSIVPGSGMDRHTVYGPDRAPAKPLALMSSGEFQLPAFVDLCHDLATHHYAVRVTVFDRMPLLAKIGRGLMVLLAVGAQVGLSFIAV